MKEKEIWRPLNGYKGYYEISSHGRVKSLERLIPHNKESLFKRRIRARIKRFSKNIKGDGYYVCSLSKNNTHINREVHRLVALHFVKRKRGCNIVNHIDTVTTNNYYKNLEWCAHRENDSYKRKNPNKTSRFIGVHWSSKPRKWKVVFRHKGKDIFVGQYDSESHAYREYKKALKRHGIKNKYA